MKRNRRILIAVALVLLAVLAVAPAFAAGYSKVYGQTQDKIRVRASASTSATHLDNIMKGAAVYIVDSKTSGHTTFVQVRYRGYEGDILTGWLCQTDGDDTYVKILSATQAEKLFGVKDGNLPTKKVGLYTKKQRDAAKNGTSSSSGSSSASSSSSGSTTITASAATIRDVQTKLKALGIYAGEITGNAGDKTVAAIKAFQRKYGLTADGVPGSQTLAKLNSVYAASSKTASSTSSSSASGSTSSSSAATIKDVQQKLKALGIYAGEITGNAGDKTVAAIKAFQRKYGLEADGVAGAKTIEKLNSVFASSGKTVSSTTSSGSSSSSSTTLKRESTGAAVRSLQENLTTLGYYNGDITGHYGSMTEAAVEKFQKAKGLSQTGIANSATLKAIASAMGSGSSSSSSGGTTSMTNYGRVTGSSVYMRSGHSTSSSSKTSLPQGTVMKITQKWQSGNDVWYYASAAKDGYTFRGYVNANYVTLISYSDYLASSGGASDEEVSGLIRVTSDGIAIREGPGTSYGKVGTANKGDMFYYVDHDDGWYKLRNGYFIMDKYATRVSDSEANTLSSGSASSSSGSYRNGDSSTTVAWIQTALKTLGYYSAEVTGHFGSKTEAAVKSFQSARGLTADGIVGSKTLTALQNALSGSSSSSSDDNTSVNVGATIYNLNWFNAKANGTLAKLGLVARHQAKLTDLRTGKTLNIYIQSAGNHLDVEPLTASDTQKLCSIYNVSSASYINYVRRPMLITTDTGAQIVCSIYGTPHGQQNITNNNYPGQFCLHFLNSKTHNSNKVDPDHAAAINEAISIVGASKVRTIDSL